MTAYEITIRIHKDDPNREELLAKFKSELAVLGYKPTCSGKPQAYVGKELEYGWVSHQGEQKNIRGDQSFRKVKEPPSKWPAEMNR